MKKKFLTFILCICFIIPAMFCLSACTQTPPDIQFKVEDGYVQYYNGETWSNLIAIADLEGEDGIGVDGKEVEFRKTSTHIQWRYVDASQGANANWKNLVSLSEIRGDEGTDGKEVEFRKTSTHIQWRYVDARQDANANWINLVALSEIQGDEGIDGKEVEFRKTSTHIQWRYIIANQAAEEGWTNLISIEELNGEDATYSTYTIIYDYQGEDLKGLFKNVKTSQSIKSTVWLSEMPEPQSEFKEFFDGWYIKESNKKIENYDFIGGDVTLEARWLENTFVEQNCLQFTYNSAQDAYNCEIDLSKESVIVPSLYNGTKGYKKVININSNYDEVDVHELRDVYLPLSLKSVGSRAFIGCAYLTNIEIPKSVLSIGDNAFQDCTNLLNVTIPNSVTEIGAFAFSGCKKLKTVEIPNSVITMGNSYYGYVFEDCVNIETIYLPKNLTRIESGLFSGCAKLKYIHIPEGLEYIGSNAFEDCSNLLELILPNSVKHIGFAAFRRCQSLTNLIIPQHVEIIGQESLYNCENLMLLIVDSSIIANDMSSIYLARVKSDCIIYIKEGLTVSNAEKFVKQESSDKDGYEMYLLNSENE